VTKLWQLDVFDDMAATAPYAAGREIMSITYVFFLASTVESRILMRAFNRLM
jgi:hypothetical protein